MPIAGLSNREPSFPRLGVIKKGGVKPQTGNRPGANLTFFRFDTDDTAAAALWKEAYPGEPREIHVFMAYPRPEQCFSAWKELWGKTGISHRCDGDRCVLHRKQDGSLSNEPVPCPGGCKEIGRLQVLLPALRRFGVVTVQTHSKNDIIELDGNLRAAYAQIGTLSGVPFVLKRAERIITKRDSAGKPFQGPEWLLTLEVDSKWVEKKFLQMQEEAMNGRLSQTHQSLALPSQSVMETEHGSVDVSTGELIDAPDDMEETDAEDGQWVPALDTEPSGGLGWPAPETKPEPEMPGDNPKVPPVYRGDPDSESPVDSPQHRTLMARLNFAGYKSEDSRHELIRLATGGRTTSSKEMTSPEAQSLLNWLPMPGPKAK